MISPSTICYALKKTYDFLRSEYLCEKTECNRKRLEEFSDAVNEIDNLKFEIEGYERVQWTRFDPKDESTFPPKGNFLYFDGFGIAIGIHLQCEKKDGFAHVYRKMTHWHPLPPPPGKEAKCG